MSGREDAGQGSNMEEFPNRQLPLRASRDKPLLKYSSSTSTTGRAGAGAGAGVGGATGRAQQQVAPVPLFSQSDLNNYRHQKGAYSRESHFGSTGIYPSGVSTTQPTGYPRVSQLSFNNFALMAGHGGANTPNGVGLTAGQLLATDLGTSITKTSVKNPYARPLSAKDIQPPDTGLIKAGYGYQWSTSSGSSSSLSSNGSISGNHGNTGSVAEPHSHSNPTNAQTTHVQTNSFMRPPSAGFKSQSKDSPVRTSFRALSRTSTKQTPLSQPASTAQTTSTSQGSFPAQNAQQQQQQQHTSVITNQSEPPQNNNKFLHKVPQSPRPPTGAKLGSSRTTVTTPRKPPLPRHQSVPTDLHAKHVLTTLSSDVAESAKGPQTVHVGSMRSSSTPSTPERSHRYKNTFVKRQLSSPNSKSEEEKDKEKGQSSNRASSANSNTSTSRPGSQDSNKSGAIVIRPGTPAAEAAARVRNLGYTPAKPYSEVNTFSNTAPSTLDPAQVEPKPEDKPKPKSARVNPLASTLSGSHRSLVNNPAPLPTSARKPPSGPTVYYKKSSKGEEVLHDLSKRRLGDGAPSKVKKVTDGLLLQDSDDSDEWEDDDDDEDENSVGGPSCSERQPGDGEDFGKMDSDDDDDALDNLDDDEMDSDDESDASSALPSRKSSPVRLRSATKRMLGMTLDDRRRSSTVTSVRSRPSTARARPVSAISTISSDSEIQPALMPSLFPNIPPTINFVIEGQQVEQLPWELRKMLKWRMSPITPNVVKLCIARSGFRPTKKNHDWLGYWGKHMKAQAFKAIREYQKVNHFPGSFQIGRKDRLWHNLSRMQMHYGKKEFNFFPQTYVLPFDMKMFKRAWEDGGSRQKWIIKPPASARGIGIKVVHKWNQIPKRRPIIVQRYLSRPYLINESKFDMRLYVYVTCYDPLRIYVYDDGLGRFASCKYSSSTKNLNNRYMHLTNYSVNKKNNEYEANSDENVCQGHKWGLKALWGYMRKQGVDTGAIWEKIKDLVVKTIISSESCVNSLVKANVKRRFSCHELFGFDVMLDENLKPWIIEVNISPSLHSNSQLDMNIKGGMIKDLMNMSALTIPDKRDVVAFPGAPQEPSKYVVPNDICIDKRLWPTQMASDERVKHAYYCQRHTDEFAQASILDTLTPDDLRILTETIDEDSRRGNFQRVFPSSISHKYLPFFEQPRYYNLLVDAWVQKYNRMEARGIALLDSFCQKGVHLENPTDDHNHQWAPPNTTIPREVRSSIIPGGSAGKPGPHPVLPKVKRKTRYSYQTGSASSLGSLSSMSRPTTTHSIADPS